MKKTLFLLFLFGSSLLIAQTTPSTLTQDLRWRSIGPANMMGRIAAIEALDTDYRHVLVASASGGVFKSTNAGMSWDAIFDDYGAGSIGSVAMFQPKPDIIWVGTGESANRNSSGFGDGIYKSTDGGKTFDHMGLETTHQIAEIAPHPTDSNIVYAAAIGHLWGYSGDRGLFRTLDGGKSWQKVTGGLPDDGKTGCTEIIFHPTNPNILFAGFYHRLRQPASFVSGGEQGGLYKSTDGGQSWKKITQGLAKGASGMIDISIHISNPDIMVMAYEADENLPEDEPGTGVYRSDDGGETWRHLLKHAVRPFYHGQIQIDPVNPDNIYVVSRGFMISKDGGESFEAPRWRKDGGDEHDMWMAPYDNKIMYLATDQGAKLSVDGGDTWLSFNNMAIGQYYAIGVDMRDPYYVIGGLQDNGLWLTASNSRETRGVLNEHSVHVGEGDGFHAQIDPTDWRTAYIVNHVGFAARVNLETREHEYITPTPETITNFADWFDPDYPETPNRYTIDPGEHWFFYEYLERPVLPAQFRFNWSSPLVMSPNNPHTIYFGGNHLFKSVDKGMSWRIISPDLTTNDPDLRNTSNGGGLTNSNTGGENHFTIITISVSPVDEDIIWVGTDDGLVHVTSDGGVSWKNVKGNFEGVPDKIWVSRVEASHHDKNRAYVTFDNHRYDDNKAYIYHTDDLGKNWQDISGNISDKYPAYVIKEDLVAPDLLFVGTEQTVHTSIDRGKTWHQMRSNLPTVAIHDLVIHPRTGDLVAGTHGRSIYIMDDIAALRQMSQKTTIGNVHAYTPSLATQWQSVFTGRKQPAFMYRGENPPPGAIIDFHISEAFVSDTATLTVTSIETGHSYQWTQAVHEGINRSLWRYRLKWSKPEIESYKTRQSEVIRSLQRRVTDKALLKNLKTLEKDLRIASSIREISNIRRTLIKDFSGYALGEPFFGEKKNNTFKAPPGWYQVNINLNGNNSEALLKVRADPLIK
jgi:photosystem II stability/assembly factor-like uncharacterized protein